VPEIHIAHQRVKLDVVYFGEQNAIARVRILGQSASHSRGDLVATGSPYLIYSEISVLWMKRLQK